MRAYNPGRRGGLVADPPPCSMTGHARTGRASGAVRRGTQGRAGAARRRGGDYAACAPSRGGWTAPAGGLGVSTRSGEDHPRRRQWRPTRLGMDWPARPTELQRRVWGHTAAANWGEGWHRSTTDPPTRPPGRVRRRLRHTQRAVDGPPRARRGGLVPASLCRQGASRESRDRPGRGDVR